jgi:hypothetical protein
MIQKIECVLPRRVIFSFALVFFGSLLPPSVARPAEAPATTQPPWNQTQERRPKEVDDKANEIPVVSCESSDPLTGARQIEVNYLDANTGTRTTIRRTEIPEQTRIGAPTPAKTVWEIVIQEPGKPKKKITYEVDPKTGDGTRTERSGKDKPTTKKITGDDLVTPPKPAPTKQSSLPAPFSSGALTRTAQLDSESMSQSRTFGSRRIFAALTPATKSQSSTGRSGSAGDTGNNGLTTVVKLVTFGNPPSQTFGLLDMGPPLTADEYVLSEAFQTLEKEWRDPEYYYYYGVDEPGVLYPGDFFHTYDGQHIDIVGDWSLARVPGGYLLSCHGFDDDDEDWSTRYRINFSDKIERLEY